MLTDNQKNHFIELAHAACECANIPVCQVDFNTPMGNSGGTYDFRTHTVNLNGKMAEVNFDDFNNVVVHEVAHAVDYFQNNKTFRKNGRGRIFHDKVFKTIMQTLIDALKNEFDNLGVPSTCHQFDSVVKTRRQRRWEYICTPCSKTFKLSTVLHNRSLKGNYRICNTCKTRLTFTGEQL